VAVVKAIAATPINCVFLGYMTTTTGEWKRKASTLNRYRILRIAIRLHMILGVLLILAGILSLLLQPFIVAVTTILSGIGLLALGQVLQVLIDIEQNTREANELARIQARNIEQYTRALLSQAQPSVAETPSETSSGFSRLA
jgi:uncharacterized membrane protein